MIRTLIGVLGAALLLHTALYWWRVRHARMEYARRLPLGSDGIVIGAGRIARDASPTHAVLILHGFGDTTQSVVELAEFLHRVHGWTVRAPLLPGHGARLADFDRFGSDSWRATVRDEYAALQTQYPTVAIVGLSMGGALATLEAASSPTVPALVLLAPYLTPPASAERLAPLAGVINLLVPYLSGGDRTKSIFDPAARSRALGAGTAPPKRVRDLVSVAHDARFAAAMVSAPTLLIHSRSDYRLPVPLAERHAGYFTGAPVLEQQWVEGSGHVITVDYCREYVWAQTASWLARHAGAPTASTAE